MYLCILALPFLGFFFTFFFGRFIGSFGCCFISSFSITLSFFLSVFAFYEVAFSGSPCTLLIFCWFSSELLLSNWGFYFDSVSVIMLLIVCGVSSIVHFYSVGYMGNDPHQSRFMSYLSLFTAFMVFLVASDNFVVMFFGWEGVGLTSFLLIGFWCNRVQAGKSAVKAMLANRVGDFGIALAIACIFLTFKTLDYLTVFALTPCVLDNYFSLFSIYVDRLTVISFFLFWGVTGKSAQIGLHIWLPDAMEGPTPVSALIHAATLVTAGVFLILRCSTFFENSPKTLFIVSIFGAFTAFFASSVGLVQNDLKRVIAYSTCSQLGYMIFSAGLSYYSVALFHLANHALFKALLFLSVGCIIHGLSDEQDMRKLGGVIQLFPISYTMVLVGSLALTGFPFLTGFYSKDAILELALSKYNFAGNFSYYLGCCAAFCTSFYSFRLIWLTFINKTNSYKVCIQQSHEAPFLMILPLLLLSLGAIFGGFLMRDMLIGSGTSLFGSSIHNCHENLNSVDSEFLHAFFKNLPFIFSFFGGLLSFFFINCFFLSKESIFSYKTTTFYKNLYTFFIQKWNFDQIVNNLIIVKTMHFGYNCSFQLFDKGVIELLGSSGFSWQLLLLSKNFSKLHSGLFYHYFFIMMFWLIIFILFSLLSFYNFLSCLNLLVLLFCYSLVVLNVMG